MPCRRRWTRPSRPALATSPSTRSGPTPAPTWTWPTSPTTLRSRLPGGRPLHRPGRQRLLGDRADPAWEPRAAAGPGQRPRLRPVPVPLHRPIAHARSDATGAGPVMGRRRRSAGPGRNGGRPAPASPRCGYLPLPLLRRFCDADRVAEVGVPLKETNPIDLVGVRPGVAKDQESVADVDDVDQAVPDDWEAPHHDLVRPP